MSKFALRPMPEIVGPIKFYKLVIDGKCEYDEFFAEVKKYGNMSSDLMAIGRILVQVSNNERLPKQKFHPLSGDCQYEAKKNSLRVYMIKDENGYIIAFGSLKNEQDTAIPRLGSIYKRYVESK